MKVKKSKKKKFNKKHFRMNLKTLQLTLIKINCNKIEQI